MAKKSTIKEGAVASANAAPKRQVSLRVPATKNNSRPSGARSNGKEARTGGTTQEVIAVRAYFICQQRLAAGLPGDSFGDWLEAERQLREDAS
jgi:hypothetical protein